MQNVEVHGLRVAYERAGDGPPLVLLHGYVGDGHTTWRHQIDALSDELTAIAWDAPGAGESSDPPESFGIAGYADCLAAFIEVLGLEPAHVVGLSFGGALAIELCRRQPRRVRSLVLVSAYAGWEGSLPQEMAAERLRQAITLSELAPDELVAALLPTMFSEVAPPASVTAFGETLRSFHPAGFRAMARASVENLRDALPAISVPTLLVYGDRDVRAPMSVAEDLHAAIRDSTLVVLRGAGHVCNIDAPEEFNRAVRTFLRHHA